jgi:hypothetical protein
MIIETSFVHCLLDGQVIKTFPAVTHRGVLRIGRRYPHTLPEPRSPVETRPITGSYGAALGATITAKPVGLPVSESFDHRAECLDVAHTEV